MKKHESCSFVSLRSDIAKKLNGFKPVECDCTEDALCYCDWVLTDVRPVWLVLGLSALLTIRAIETPGGDDDRQYVPQQFIVMLSHSPI